METLWFTKRKIMEGTNQKKRKKQETICIPILKFRIAN